MEVPAGFSGNFVLDLGVHGASPLPKDGDVIVVRVPRDGKLETSTVVEKPSVGFQNAGSSGIWGFSERTFATGNGISTGGKIEFFAGTQKEFDADQQKKNKSRGFFTAEAGDTAFGRTIRLSSAMEAVRSRRINRILCIPTTRLWMIQRSIRSCRELP